MNDHWIFLSPHLDDAVLSCGGMIYELVNRGKRVEIFTICAGDPPDGQPLSPLAIELHTRWQTGSQAIAARRAEDMAACHSLGITYKHFNVPDCIYRINPVTGEPLISANEALFQPLMPEEYPLRDQIAKMLLASVPPTALLVSPLTLGGHVDHYLTRSAAEQTQLHMGYYADYPYVIQNATEFEQLLQPDWSSLQIQVSPAGLSAWQQAVSQHKSQISTFWGGIAEMESALKIYASQGGGSWIWGHQLR